jgi:hypothetical protein
MMVFTPFRSLDIIFTYQYNLSQKIGFDSDSVS